MGMPYLEKRLSEEMVVSFNACLKELKKRHSLGRTRELVYQVTIFNANDEFDPG